MCKTMIFSALVLMTFGLAAGKTIYVPDHSPTIQGAIKAAVDNDVIIVRPGTYVENIDFVGKAITVTSECGPENTIIDGNQIRSVVTFRNGEGSDSVLEGFTIRNGNASNGGGICCVNNSSPMIVGNHIKGNSATTGGGIFAVRSHVEIIGNRITLNTAVSHGGGIHSLESNPRIAFNFISENYNGEESSAVDLEASMTTDEIIVEHNTIISNHARGIEVTDGASVIINGNAIIKNSAIKKGGGILTRSGAGRMTIVNNIISGNYSAKSDGGVRINEAVPGMVIRNNTITHNLTPGNAGGLSIKGGDNLDLKISNCILWDNDAALGQEIYLSDSGSPNSLTISHCDIKDCPSSIFKEPNWTVNYGPGMIDSDPLFVETVYDDYHLTWDSPCRDSGDDTVVTDLLDFESDPRIAGSAVDMGADEFHEHLYKHGSVIPNWKITLRIVGTPTAPVTLALGSGVKDPPHVTPYGDLWLTLPITQYGIGAVPSNGVLVCPATIPGSMNPGDEMPLQALIGPFGNPATVLSNLMVLTVK